MILKLLAASAALSMLGVGAAAAQDYGTPPYASGAYGYAGYDGGGCEGFTIAGAHAGVTVLGINVGGGARARVGGDCHGGYAGGYAPAEQPAYPPGAYVNGGYYNQEETYPQPAYVNQGYAPVAYPSQPTYGAPAYGYSSYRYSQPVYAAPSYGYAQPCGCQGYMGY